MFQKKIGNDILEVSHKRIEHPGKSLYFKHIHNHCEILLFINSDVDYSIDGQIFKPAPYDLLFVPAATYHYVSAITPTPYENYVIGISPEFIPAAQYQKLFSPPLMIHVENDNELISFFKRLDFYHTCYEEEDFSHCAASLIRELVTYCSYQKDEWTSAHSENQTHIDKIIRYIAEHLEQPLDAEEIARECLLSKSYIQNIFSRHMRIGLKRYIMQKKIYAAHNDLLRGLSPNEACEKYCFGDYSVFYRLYKRTFHESPRDIQTP